MSFIVTIMPGNYRIQVAADETILAAGLRQGLGLLYGCRSGLCGTCSAEILHGGVTYPKGRPRALNNYGQNACLLCQAIPLSDMQCRVTELIAQGQAQPPQLLSCRVEQREQVSHDVVRLILGLPQGMRLQFLPGQYLEIILNDGRRRVFSLANSPYEDTHVELHIRQIPGGIFTDQVLADLTIGHSLQINAPLGNFTLRAADRPLLFIAGGTGFAPIKSLIEQVLQGAIPRPIYFYWGVRSRQDLYLPALPETWSRRYPNFHFIPVLAEPEQDWQGRNGLVHQVVCADHPDPSSFDAYLAGPPIMVQAAIATLEMMGLNREHIFADAFEYAASEYQAPTT